MSSHKYRNKRVILLAVLAAVIALTWSVPETSGQAKMPFWQIWKRADDSTLYTAKDDGDTMLSILFRGGNTYIVPPDGCTLFVGNDGSVLLDSPIVLEWISLGGEAISSWSDIGTVTGLDTSDVVQLVIDTGGAYFQPLHDILTSIAGGVIAENLTNTAYPWADNEIASSGNWNAAYGWGDHASANYLDDDIDGDVDTSDFDDAEVKEYIADMIGTMVTGNTESGISVTFEDADNTLDFIASGGGLTLAGVFSYLSRAYFDTLADASSDSIVCTFSDSTDLSVFDTDDLTEGAANKYDQDLPDSSKWSNAYSWGNHATQNYLDDDVAGDVDSTDLDRVEIKEYIEDILGQLFTGSEYGILVYQNDPANTFTFRVTGVTSTMITDGTVTEADLNITNTPGADEDNYVLTYNHAGTNMTWAPDATAGGLDLVSMFAYFSRAYFDTTITGTDDNLFCIYSDSTDLSVFDTDDLTEGSSNLYDQDIPDSSFWSDYPDTASAIRSEMPDSAAAVVGDSLANYSLTSVIASLYATLTDFGKIADDTTNYQSAYGWGDHSSQNYLDNDDANVDTSHYRIAYDSSQFDNLRSTEAAADVDTTGTEIAAALAGCAKVSVDTVSKEATIYGPDAVNDSIPLCYIDSTLYPYGVTVIKASIELGADAAYSMIFLAYSNADPPAYGSAIDTVTTGAGDAYMSVASGFDDASLAVGERIYLGIPATDVDWVKAMIVFTVNGAE